MEDKWLPYFYFQALAQAAESCVNLAAFGLSQSGNLHFFFPPVLFLQLLVRILNLHSIPAKCQDQ